MYTYPAAAGALVGLLDRIPTTPLALMGYLVIALFVYAIISTFFDVPWYRKGYDPGVGAARRVPPGDEEPRAIEAPAPPPATSRNKRLQRS